MLTERNFNHVLNISSVLVGECGSVSWVPPTVGAWEDQKRQRFVCPASFLFSHILAAKISPRPRNIANMLSVAALVGVVLFGVSRKEPVPYLGNYKKRGKLTRRS